VKVARVQNGTTLLGDLGIGGDDADDFFVEFHRQFDVDLSAFDLSRHFGSEGLPIWGPIYWLVLLCRQGSPEERARLEPISVADLITAAKCGKWVYKP